MPTPKWLVCFLRVSSNASRKDQVRRHQNSVSTGTGLSSGCTSHYSAKEEGDPELLAINRYTSGNHACGLSRSRSSTDIIRERNQELQPQGWQAGNCMLPDTNATESHEKSQPTPHTATSLQQEETSHQRLQLQLERYLRLYSEIKIERDELKEENSSLQHALEKVKNECNHLSTELLTLRAASAGVAVQDDGRCSLDHSPTLQNTRLRQALQSQDFMIKQLEAELRATKYRCRSRWWRSRKQNKERDKSC